MFDRIGRSIELAKASFRVLRADKELLLFPFVSFLVLIVVSISFIVPSLVLGVFDDAVRGEVGIMSYVLAFLFYVVSYTVIFFFNTALVGAALIRLDGGDPTLRDGFRIAFSRLPQILVYAVIAATVGMILRWISERAGIIGQIVAGIIGFAWSVATFLVVPVLVVEKVGPIEAIKRSGSLLRKTWGEQIVGNFGIGIVFGLLIFAVIGLGLLLMFLALQVSGYLALAVVLVMLVLVGIVALVGSALSGIYTASVYRYATKGDGGEMFRTETLAGAFRPKK
jgi:uncharacterized protein DUF6159